MTTFLTSTTHPHLPIPYPFKIIKIHMTHFVGIATQIPPTGDNIFYHTLFNKTLNRIIVVIFDKFFIKIYEQYSLLVNLWAVLATPRNITTNIFLRNCGFLRICKVSAAAAEKWMGLPPPQEKNQDFLRIREKFPCGGGRKVDGFAAAAGTKPGFP